MKIVAIIRRVIREMFRDKRTLALMFVAPLLLLTLMYFLFQSNNNGTADLAVRQVDSTLVKAVKNKHIKLHYITNTDAPRTVIRQHDYAGMLTQKGHKITLTLQNSDQSKTGILKQSLQAAQIKLKMQGAGTAIKAQQKVIQQLSAALSLAARRSGMLLNPNVMKPEVTAKNTANYTAKTNYLYGSSNSTYFSTLLPIMMGFLAFFFVFLISGIALLRERTTGTLYRLLATPVKRGEIITGYLSGYGIFAVIQTLLIVIFSIYVFKVQILGSIWNVFLISILIAIGALAMGLFISTFAASEFQMVQFIPIIVIPQVFFSGLIPISQMAGWLRVIAHLMPLYYGATALSNVIEKGTTFSGIVPDLTVLLGFAILFIGLNLISMRRYRQV